VKSNSKTDSPSKGSFAAEEAIQRLRWTTVVVFAVVELGGILAVLIQQWRGTLRLPKYLKFRRPHEPAAKEE